MAILFLLIVIAVVALVFSYEEDKTPAPPSADHWPTSGWDL